MPPTYFNKKNISKSRIKKKGKTMLQVYNNGNPTHNKVTNCYSYGQFVGFVLRKLYHSALCSTKNFNSASYVKTFGATSIHDINSAMEFI